MSIRRQLPWFAVVGVTATATHFIVGLSAERWLGLSPLAANTVAFLCALGVSYFGNAVLTFRIEPWRANTFAKFAVLSLAAYGLNQLIVGALTKEAGWSYAASLLVVLAVVPPLTFVLAKLWALAPSAREP
jgi:putative flippase GtrA